jgi:hypothetical protein
MVMQISNARGSKYRVPLALLNLPSIETLSWSLYFLRPTMWSQ